MLGTRRRFGNIPSAAIAEYERHGRSLSRAVGVPDAQREGPTEEDLDETRAILAWRHEGRRQDSRKAFLVEGPLRTAIGEHPLNVRFDRLTRKELEALIERAETVEQAGRGASRGRT